ncbi:MAG TPA: ABC transporter substrate-binding protein [Nitrososphaerales archaeon]|nr:ABC transporter substrate-binding protein [Nitrososphaerales archaeon]
MVARLFNEVLGAEVDIPESPLRIVSFSPAATETLFEVGAGQNVIGVSAFCARPKEAQTKRKVGSYSTVREEVLSELKPDLILTVTGYQRDFAVKLSKKFPVYPLELPLTVAGIVDFVEKVSFVAGREDEGRKLARGLMKRIGGMKSGGSKVVYVEADLGGPVTFGAFSYITDAIGLFGSSSVYERAKSEWLEPDFQAVKETDPDIILYEAKMYSEGGEGALQKIVESRGWEGLKAVRAGNCFVTPGPLDFLAHHGPSFVREALPWLEEKLVPEGK